MAPAPNIMIMFHSFPYASEHPPYIIDPLCNAGETETRIGYVSSVTGSAPAYYGVGTATYAITGAGFTFAV